MSQEKLREAEAIAVKLFEKIEELGLISAGKTEKELNEEIFKVADESFGIKKHWHKRIVRSGSNTLYPYYENPPNLTLQEDDILFFDFGPILDEWEADLGRTYVIGNNPDKLRLKNDIEHTWHAIKNWFDQQEDVTGSELYKIALGYAERFGWEFGGEMAGHIIGQFPHEKLDPNQYDLYIHPDNHKSLMALDKNGKKRSWILEVHFVDSQKEIGGFYEQLLT
ncbi:MAG: aminopeptidase P family protein [Cyclobacteriaceae bacterium]